LQFWYSQTLSNLFIFAEDAIQKLHIMFPNRKPIVSQNGGLSIAANYLSIYSFFNIKKIELNYHILSRVTYQQT